MNKELLKKLYMVHSPSGNEKAMIEFITNLLSEMPDVEVSSDSLGNIYAKRGNAETYPCIVAHMDEVHAKRPNGFKLIEKKCQGDTIICGKCNRKSQGIGADDKNGIFVALEMIRRYPVMKCAFFVGEETGCIGSSDANMDFFKDCRYVLQCDRQGNSDFIVNASGVSLCTEEFVFDCNIDKFQYEEELGLMTDVMALKERGLDVCACNMSCGYYCPHTNMEYTSLKDLKRCMELVIYIIENCKDVYPHKYDRLNSFECVYDDYEYARRAIEGAIFYDGMTDIKEIEKFCFELMKKVKTLCWNDIENILDDLMIY